MIQPNWDTGHKTQPTFFHRVPLHCNTHLCLSCRWLVLAMAMLRFYIQKGTHKGLYRSIARTLKFFQTFALVEVRQRQRGGSGISVTVIRGASSNVCDFYSNCLLNCDFNSGEVIKPRKKKILKLQVKNTDEYIDVCPFFDFQVGHCAIGKWQPLTIQRANGVSRHLASFQCSPVLIGYRNCEDVCDCHRGSSVFSDFHGLVHHQQHQTGDWHQLSIYFLLKGLPFYFVCTRSKFVLSGFEADLHLVSIALHLWKPKSLSNCSFAITLTC